MVVWWWLLFVAIMSALGLVLWLLTATSSSSQRAYVKKYLKIMGRYHQDHVREYYTSSCTNYPTGKKFHWNLNFTISLMANSLNLNSAYHFILRKLSMMAHIIDIKKFHPVGYIDTTLRYYYTLL